eukprot:scaffold59582_cov27-Tisochrysis_lutea.AAC.1
MFFVWTPCGLWCVSHPVYNFVSGVLSTCVTPRLVARVRTSVLGSWGALPGQRIIPTGEGWRATEGLVAPRAPPWVNQV